MESIKQTIERLEKERDALAAHVDKISKLFLELRKHHVANFSNGTHEFICNTRVHENWHKITDFFDQSNNTSLAEHDAEVARKGFIKGYWIGTNHRLFISEQKQHCEDAANEYAQRVKDGEL